MTTAPCYHTSVLATESVGAVVGNPAGTYVDATFGGGGHSRAMLARLGPAGRLLALDKDPDARANALDDPRFTLVQGNFRHLENYVALHIAHGSPIPEEGVVDGILADLGVSSHQFDTQARGFSFRFPDSPLDMRMNPEDGPDAAEALNTYGQDELERILTQYGELRQARQMAQCIVRSRAHAPLRTAGDLNNALADTLPVPAMAHKTLAKVYQALRMEVNRETRSLERLLEGAARCLRGGGRIAVIAYHSLEDRIVKQFLRGGNALTRVNPKPILPSEEEIAANPRARSAKLRIGEKTTAPLP